MGKLFGEEWRALTPDEKKEYDVLAKDDKERYDTEFTQVRRTDHSHRLKRHLLFVCGIPVNYRRRGWRHLFARGRALACNLDWCACACAVCRVRAKWKTDKPKEFEAMQKQKEEASTDKRKQSKETAVSFAAFTPIK